MPQRSRAALRTRLGWAGLAAILVLAVWLRAQHLGYGLPYLRHPDEARYVRMAHRIYRSADLNPHFFRVPSLFLYVNAATQGAYELARSATGNPAPVLPPTVLATGVGFAPHPMTFILGRTVSLIASLATVLAAYGLGKALADRAAGLVSALLVGASPAVVAYGRVITPDSMVLLFSVVGVWASVRLLSSRARGWYVLAAGAVGLATASKYNGLFFLSAPLAAHLLRWRQCRHRWAYVVLLPLLTWGFFAAASPFAILDHAAFVNDLRAELSHYSEGHPGMEGGYILWYGGALLRDLGPGVGLALVALVVAIRRRQSAATMVALLTAGYVLFISCFPVRNARTMLPAIPLIAAQAGWLLSRLKRCARTTLSVPPKRLGAAATLLAATLALFPLAGSLRANAQLRQPDPRDTARPWCNRNLPLGARVAIESYSVYLDPRRFLVDGFFRIIDHPAQWYREEGYEYLVLSSGAYRRYIRSPVMYPEQSHRYRLIFDTLPLVMAFRDGSPEILVYEVTPSDRS